MALVVGDGIGFCVQAVKAYPDTRREFAKKAERGKYIPAGNGNK
jgi:hypothetical protein